MATRRTAHRVTTVNTIYYVLTTINRTGREYWEKTQTECRVWGSNGRFFTSEYAQDIDVGQHLRGDTGTGTLVTTPIVSVERITIKQWERAVDPIIDGRNFRRNGMLASY